MATFLDLCNQVLRRVNEPEITSAGFNSTRGIHTLVKDAVRASLDEINRAEFEWPFNYATGNSSLVVGQNEYAFPSDLKTVEWDSFQIQDGTSYRALIQISREEWYSKYRDEDYEAGSSGLGLPLFVFPSHQYGFGVTCSPDDTYTIRYNYYLTRSVLENSDDTPRVPAAFDYVIVDGALYHMYMFKDNAESASDIQKRFRQGIKDLQSILLNRFTGIYDTRVNFGGPSLLKDHYI